MFIRSPESKLGKWKGRGIPTTHPAHRTLKVLSYLCELRSRSCITPFLGSELFLLLFYSFLQLMLFFQRRKTNNKIFLGRYDVLTEVAMNIAPSPILRREVW